MALRDTSWIVDSNANVVSDANESLPLNVTTPGGIQVYTTVSRTRVREWIALTEAAAEAYANDTGNLTDSITLEAIETNRILKSYKVVERLQTQTTTLDTIV